MNSSVQQHCQTHEEVLKTRLQGNINKNKWLQSSPRIHVYVKVRVDRIGGFASECINIIAGKLHLSQSIIFQMCTRSMVQHVLSCAGFFQRHDSDFSWLWQFSLQIWTQMNTFGMMRNVRHTVYKWNIYNAWLTEMPTFFRSKKGVPTICCSPVTWTFYLYKYCIL